MKLRVLTLNAGLYEVRKLGFVWVTPAQYIQERLKALPAELARADADVILLQEVIDTQHREQLAAALKTEFPFTVTDGIQPDRWPNDGHGLMIFSRYPIGRTGFQPFKTYSWLEGIVIEKGFLYANVTVPKFGTLTVVNFHTVSGRNAEAPNNTRTRSRQLSQMFHALDSWPFPLIVGGDLNAGPVASSQNYVQFLEKGYADVCITDLETGLRVPDNSGHTWDGANPLVAQGPHREQPSQRIDGVFTKSAKLRPLGSRVVLNDAIVQTPHGIKVPLSDHYGVMAHIELL